MMTMPMLNATETQVENVNTFGGYNHKMSINDGEFFDMKNLACDDFPLAASRAKRGLHPEFSIPGAEIIGVVGQDQLNVVYRKDMADLEFVFAETFGANTVTLRHRADFMPLVADAMAGRLAKITTGNTVEYVTVLSNTASYTLDTPDGYKYIDVTFAETPSVLTAESIVRYSWGLEFREYEGNNVYVFWIEKEKNPEFNHIPGFMSGYQLTVIQPDGTASSYNITRNSDYVQSVDRWSVGITLDEELETITSDSIIYVEQPFAALLDDYAQPGGGLRRAIGLYPSEALPVNSLIDKKITVTTDDFSEDLIVEGHSASVADPTSPTGFSETVIVFTENPLVNFKSTSEFTMISGKLCMAEYDMSLQEMTKHTVLCPVAGGEHTVLKMGAYVVVFPEKIKVNTTKITGGMYSEVKNLEKNLDRYINWRMCYHDGDELTIDYASDTAHDNPEHGEVWADTTESPAVLRKYNENLATWAVIAPYIEFYSTFELGIEEYDALEVDFGTTLSGYVDLVESQKYYVVSSAGKYDANGHIPDNYYFRFPVAFKAATPSSYTSVHAQFNTSIPVLDYVFECNNRLWGCRYGEDSKGDFINEIFASRLGDPGNFHYFANTSMDSYYVSLGDEGPFTGGIAYNSQPVFFRQNKVHRISGSFPANYQLKTTVGYGCQKGSYRSIVSVNNIVYYLSTVGIMAYSGDIPVSMADAFGTEMYHAGVAGTIGNKYYISMHAEDGAPVLFVYDDAKAMWHKEDNLDVKQFLSYDGECYAVTEDNRLIATGGVTGALEPDFDWMMETGEIGYSSPFKKHLIKVNIRLKLGITSHCIMDINYDSGDNWIHCADIRPTGKVHMVNIPISPYRCDYFKIRIRGTGEVKLLSVTKFYNEGSDEA